MGLAVLFWTNSRRSRKLGSVGPLRQHGVGPLRRDAFQLFRQFGQLNGRSNQQM